ncbi:MAG: hypothetical protein K2H85_02560, partial [Allobaculum sp.]|nr:hypothetical protein [Allobaculum sp.]
HSNDIDIFINPVMTRIPIQEIDGAFLIIKSKGTDYVFAIPGTLKAGTIIMNFICNNGNISISISIDYSSA